MKTIKIYHVSTFFSSRDIQARNKKEAIRLFKQQLGNLISDSDKITIK
jgi:hypothetical protein